MSFGIPFESRSTLKTEIFELFRLIRFYSARNILSVKDLQRDMNDWYMGPYVSVSPAVDYFRFKSNTIGSMTVAQSFLSCTLIAWKQYPLLRIECINQEKSSYTQFVRNLCLWYEATVSIVIVPRTEVGGVLMSPPCLESQGCHAVWSHFSISSLLFLCLLLPLFLSYPFMLLAHSPDLFFP